ncbi:MAG: hypothetical protein K6B45_05645 [Bacteroidaceae bacterium]|nr:hypothetical protein [Bacteroidaceae bacterium]
MMMKRATLAVAFLLCVVTALGQNDAESQGKRFWDAGALTWDDFRVEPRYAALSRDSYLSWGMCTATDTVRTGNLTILRLTSRTYLDNATTWVRNGSQTDRLLRFHQMAFDHTEMLRRLFQLELDSVYRAGTDQETIHSLWQRKGAEFSAASTLLDSLCAQGNDTVTTAEMERLTREALSQLDSASAVLPDIRRWKSPWSIGIHLLSLIPTTELRAYLRPLIGFGISFEKLYGRHWLGLEGNVASGSSLAAFPEKNWDDHQPYDLTNWRAFYGYSICNSNYWRITPRIGVSTIGVVPKKRSSADVSTSGIHAVGPSAGMQIEYKTHRRLQLYPAAGGGCRYTESTIGCRIDATRIVSRSSSAGGWWYNVSFVWGGLTLVPKSQ